MTAATGGRPGEAASIPQRAAEVTDAAGWTTFRARAVAAADGHAWSRAAPARRVLLAGPTDTDVLADMLSVLGSLVTGVALETRTVLRPTSEEAIAAAAAEAAHADVVVLVPWEPSTDPDYWSTIPASLARARALVRSTWPGSVVVELGSHAPAHEADLDADAALSAARRSVLDANARIESDCAAETGVEFVDVELVAARLGVRRWHDRKLAGLGISSASLDALLEVTREIVRAIGALLGLSRRVIATDLDDTFWGGVLGEVGARGVIAGRHPRAAGFTAYQRFLGAAQRAGVQIVAVSKNELTAVEDAFGARDDFAFGFDDFARVSCGWKPKSEQLAELAASMHLPLEHFVFIDDNPFECAEVADRLPAVDVVRFEPAREDVWPRLVSRPTLPPFGTSRQEESRTRRESYLALAAAQRDAEAHATHDEFLASIELRVSIEPIAEDTFDRAHALVQKTNQMNLTLRRASPVEFRERLEDPDVIGVTMFCRDRYADHGQTGVGVVRIAGDDASIEWLCMSCRVLGRSIERLLLHRLVTLARGRGARRVTVDFATGPQNGLARTLLDDCGFAADAGQDADSVRYTAPDRWPEDTIPAWLEQGERTHDEI